MSATVWSGIDTFARQGLQFVITLILARLLTPADYGTVGLLAVFLGLASVFVDSGFSSALIQRQAITDTDLSSIFYFNLAMSFLAATALGLTSPLVAAFYDMPVLRPLTWLLAGDLVIGSFGTIQRTLLSKTLNFRRQCIISLASVAVSGTIAVLLAWNGYGVWSLGIQYLTATFVSVLLLWVLSSWRPSLVFSLQSVRSLFGFGSFMLLSGLLNTLFSRLNTLLIGKFYSAADLGYYSRADSLRLLPGFLLSGIIDRVAFPVFSAAHEDKSLLRAGLRKAISLVMMLNFPIMLGMIVTGESLVLVLFGVQWVPCVPYLQILCLGGMLWPLHVLNLNVLQAQGHSNLFFRLEVIKKVVGIVLLAIACPYGIVAIAWSSVVGGVICFGINAHYSGRLLNYGAFRQMADLLPYLTGSMIMAACVWCVALLPIQSPVVALAIQIPGGAIIYMLFCQISKLKAFAEAVEIVALRSRLSS